MSTSNDLAVPGGIEIVLLPHLLWAKNFITRIYSSEPAESARYLDAFLSQKAVIVVNGVETSRSAFIDSEKGTELLRQGAQVTFSDTVETADDPKLGDWVIILLRRFMLIIEVSDTFRSKILYRVKLWGFSSPSTSRKVSWCRVRHEASSNLSL